jgi:hypothetical protein
MTGIFKMVMDGGVFFIIPIMVLIIVILGLFLTAFKDAAVKAAIIKKISAVSIFALTLGILGQVIGLMEGFKVIEAMGEIAPKILAGGLRVSFISTFFGLFAFLIGRLSIIVLEWRS